MPGAAPIGYGCAAVVLLVAHLGAMLDATSRPREPEGQQLTAAEIVKQFNSRRFGQSGLREVTLQTSANGRFNASYRLIHYWSLDSGACTSVFAVLEPDFLRGTSCLIRERSDGRVAPNVWLRLNTGKDAIHVPPSRLDECVLGTDFCYRDLMFLIDQTGFRFAFLPSQAAGQSVCRISAESESDSHAVWSRRVFHIDRIDFKLLE